MPGGGHHAWPCLRGRVRVCVGVSTRVCVGMPTGVRIARRRYAWGGQGCCGGAALGVGEKKKN